MTTLRPARILSRFALAALVAVAACSGDSTGASNDDSVVGVWQATSMKGGTTEFLIDGMTVRATITATTYSLAIISDQAGFCDGPDDCTITGNYTRSGTTFTIDPGTEDEAVFSLSFQGNTMTWSGTIDGESATFRWTRTT